MITYKVKEIVQIGREKSISRVRIHGLSTDPKPTENVANGSEFIEQDTGKLYHFDESGKVWLPYGGE